MNLVNQKQNGRITRISVLLTILILALVSLIGIGCQSSKKEGKLRDVTLRLPWKPHPVHAYLYVAIKKGYFKEEGINLKILAPSSPGESPKLVAQGSDDFGMVYPESFIVARAEGLPITSVGATIRDSGFGLIVTGDSDITKPSQLVGKKLGTAPVPLFTSRENQIVKTDGGDASKVKKVNAGFNLVTPLLSGKLDAIIGLSFDEFIQAQMKGAKPKMFKATDFGSPAAPLYVIFAHEKTLKNDPELIKSFLKATKKGIQFTIDNPDETAAIFQKQWPEYSLDLTKRELDAYVPLLHDSETDKNGLGWMSEKTWETVQDWLFKNKLITKKTAIEKLHTNEFLEDN